MNTFMDRSLCGNQNQCADQGAATAFLAIALSSAIVAEGSSNAAAPRFSRRWFSEDVPGISRMLGERCRSQASAICIGVACNDAASPSSTEDCKGVNPPNGKKGTYATPCCASVSTKASSARCATL